MSLLSILKGNAFITKRYLILSSSDDDGVNDIVYPHYLQELVQ